MIPLPQFVLREVSHALQLVSSQLGVALIRQFGISVFLEGNVIDLGSYKLQVVEACNGLRYLFPLMVLGFLAAYFFRGPWWQRLLIIASTIPLTIVINSLRIGMIGVTVEYWGVQMAEGLLHDLEGWFMFLVCLALLVAEMALLARLDPQRRGLGGLLALELPAPAPAGAGLSVRRNGPASLAVLGLLVAAAALAAVAPQQQLQKPARQAFTAFPLNLPGGWQGRADRIAPDILAVLAVDDYFIANYARPAAPWVNFYTAYYASQSGGQSSHSPRTCIPGDGWAIVSITPLVVALDGGARMTVNQAVIQKGEQRQLVHYWFQQRGQAMTGEYEVKWGILRDALLHDRSDGALIRLVTPVLAQEGQAAAEQRLTDFLRTVQPHLRAFIPD
jgi:exosortase D (VPLPA-CTERM-specific)